MSTKLSSAAFVVLLTTTLGVTLHRGTSVPTGYEQIEKSARDLKVGSRDLVGKWPQSAKRYALIVGVDEYLQDPQISKLDGAGNDAKALAATLVEDAGFLKDQVVLLTCDQPPDRWPTRSNILRRLSNFRRAVPEDGLLVVFFAGHGIEREGHAFLLPADAQLSGDIGLLQDTAIDAETIRERIRQVRIGQVVIILDACRSDPLAARGGADNPLTGAYTRSLTFDERNLDFIAFATLYATALGSRSFEYKQMAHGYFTWALVQGLKGAAANNAGEVTLKSLVDYLQAEVPKRTSLDLGPGEKQRPFAVIEGYKADELVLASPGVSGLSSAGSGRTAVLSSAAKERVFWEVIKDSQKPFAFLTYLDLYPRGKFAGLAKRRLEVLRKEEERRSLRHPPARAASPLLTTWDVNLSSTQFKQTLKLVIKLARGDLVGTIRSGIGERLLSSIALNRREITFVDKRVLEGREIAFTFKGVIDADLVMRGDVDMGVLGTGRWSAVHHYVWP